MLILIGVAILSGIAIKYLVRIPVVQTWVVQRATDYLTKELGTKVTVSRVEIKLFRSLVLRDLFIEDQQHDTLLYAKRFKARISQFSIPKRRITLSLAELDNARIAIKFYKNPRKYNLDFILDYFSGTSKDTTASKPWDVKVDQIKLVENTFSYRDLKYTDTTRCIDWDDIFLTHLNVELSDLRPRNDSLPFVANHLSFVEKSGFKINDFAANTVITSKAMDFKKVHIVTPFSDVHADIHFDFDSIDDFQDFISKVRCKADFEKSKVSFSDLAYFASELIGLKKTVSLKGSASGTVERFKAKNIELVYTPGVYFKGNVNMNGLPDFNNTYMEISANDLSLNKRDLETIPTWPFESSTNLKLPDNLTTLGIAHFKGKFNGFYNDFVAYGNTTTDAGFISSDINLKIAPKDKNTTYSGNITLFDFDMGKLLRLNPNLGKVSMKANVKGSGFELINLNANIEGDFSMIQLNNYSYSNIKMNGHIGKKLFNGDLSINDPNLDLNFRGDIDLNSDIPIYNFNSTIRKAHLSTINLMNRDSSANLSAEVNINMTGSNIDNAQGTILVENAHYSESGNEVKSDRIFLESKIGSRRELNLQSNFADMQIVGNYNLSDFLNSARWIISRYLPIDVYSKIKPPINQDINFHVETKNTDKLTAIFLPVLHVDKNTILEGQLNTNTNSLNVLLNSEIIKLNDIKFKKVNVQGSTDGNHLAFKSSIQELDLSDSISIDNLAISGNTNRDSAEIIISLNGSDSAQSKALVKFDTHFLNTGYTSMKVIPEKLLLKSVNWSIDPSNYILFDSTGVLLENFNLISDSQRVDISGIISKDTSAKMSLGFKNFEAAQLNDFLSLYEVQLGGVVNGKAHISGLLGKPILNSDLQIQNLRWYADTIGNAQVNTQWNSVDGYVDVKGFVDRGLDKNIDINGRYLFKDKGDEIDFNINLQKTYIQSFNHYLKGIFSNLGGIANAKLHLFGPVKKPNLTGKVYLQKVTFMVDYLKTTYNFSGEVDLNENSMSFKNVILNDAKGQHATVSGRVLHDHLKDFYLDIEIAANKTQVLNTTAADNELFYGTAYATGNVNISGYLDYIMMNIGLKSEKGTKINIPLSNPEEISNSNFISFIKTDSTQKAKVDNGQPDFSGVELNMDFEVTQDANIYLIFDSKIGDVIEGNGHGNITMSVSPSEDFRMFGNFEIEQGKYLFTLQNVINKPFFIERGGYIRWNGDPYDATVNINATYKLKAGLYDLFQDSSFRKLVPVDLQLHLSDKLFNPTISFDINVENVDPTIDTQIKRWINTEEEKYRQAVSLLLMRRFTSPSQNDRAPINSGGGVGANAYELLSNQLSNWASQISNQVNVGVNYRQGDALTSEELEIALSTSILNDRVNIDVNGGYANTSTTGNQNTSSLVGDFTVEVKASKDGRVRLKAFNRSNNNSLINNVNSPYTQGVGVFYRQEFNDFHELTTRFKEWFKRKSKTQNIPLN